MAGGVVAALSAQGMAGSVPVSGQDGDHAAINRIALGTQTVSIWKDARDLGKTAGEAAVELGAGKKMTAIPDVKPFTGGAKGVKVNGILLTPLPITRANLNVIVDKGWITKAEVCAGVKPGTVKLLQAELTASAGSGTKEAAPFVRAARLSVATPPALRAASA